MKSVCWPIVWSEDRTLEVGAFIQMEFKFAFFSYFTITAPPSTSWYKIGQYKYFTQTKSQWIYASYGHLEPRDSASFWILSANRVKQEQTCTRFQHFWLCITTVLLQDSIHNSPNNETNVFIRGETIAHLNSSKSNRGENEAFAFSLSGANFTHLSGECLISTIISSAAVQPQPWWAVLKRLRRLQQISDTKTQSPFDDGFQS